MERQRCQCNGSTGTDCYYCQGTGFIIEPIHIKGFPIKETNPTAEYLQKLNLIRTIPLTERIEILEFEMRVKHSNLKILKLLGNHIDNTYKELLLAKQPTTTRNERLYQDLLKRGKKLQIDFKRKNKSKNQS